ncbi:MAG: signal peptidase I [Rhodospirillaceae bacterium]|jgi:signal peptidase I|nr:signal peptidase I [Rhodospirillaceae bacterium]MBT3886099.1 signal peptidase I [Rhodospirillaceae bacterium]MBT4115080.1 signal peptidase I [Rhodospirillaceae bacterium]MBT4674302.1 signal peptidase I [Rhodospirillaceae bacterium]MBT4721173.1 signal peptidase I [Rhodospirillaceae bacterium]
MSDSKPNSLKDTIKTVVYAVLIALVVRTVGFEPFNIPSGSMIPTLLVGDYLFVSKYSYGYSRYSLPFGLPLIPGRVLFTEPERGDVAVFKLPTDNKTDYIKRIIGLPGDRIQVRRGILHINGAPVIRKRISDFVETNQYGNVVRVARFEETLPGGRKHEILEITDNGPLDNTDLYIVPAGHYFAMGDNRDNSQDSRVRSAVGFIPKANLVGRAEVLFYSTNGAARWYQFWKWPVAMRFKRFFQGVT